MSREKWKFKDGPDTACFVSHRVIEGSTITFVSHDYDGDWQFHGDNGSDINKAKLVGLSHVLDMDASIAQLCDLPNGWTAERKSAKHKWRTYKNHPFPSFKEDGFHLEDATWLAQFRDDLDPPTERRRKNRKVDDYVKLIFRFAKENAPRKDGQSERMWVRITQCDTENGHYTGELDNDPLHEAAKSGDVIPFHPLHIAEVLKVRKR